MWNILDKYNWYKQRNVLKNGVETIVDRDRIFCLNENIWDHKNVRVTRVKYFWYHKEHIYKLADQPKTKKPKEFLYVKN